MHYNQNPLFSTHYFQVPHVSVPYHGDIPNGLVPGKKIFISGQANGDQFVINLKGPQGIALHLNPRFSSNAFVRNTCIHGSWGNEERNGQNPFQKNQLFDVVILVETDRYRIAVNGTPVCDYRHRIPFSEVTHLDIHGDNLALHRIVFG